MGILLAVLVSIASQIIDNSADTGLLELLTGLTLLLPGLAPAGRRHHWVRLFLALIPLLGAVLLIVLLCQPSRARVPQPLCWYPATQ